MADSKDPEEIEIPDDVLEQTVRMLHHQLACHDKPACYRILRRFAAQHVRAQNPKKSSTSFAESFRDLIASEPTINEVGTFCFDNKDEILSLLRDP